jgi:hypothetical protein
VGPGGLPRGLIGRALGDLRACCGVFGLDLGGFGLAFGRLFWGFVARLLGLCGRLAAAFGVESGGFVGGLDLRLTALFIPKSVAGLPAWLALGLESGGF